MTRSSWRSRLRETFVTVDAATGSLPGVLLFVLALAVTGLFTWTVFNTERESSHMLFDRNAHQIAAQIRQRMNVYQRALIATRNLFLARSPVSRDEFRAFVTNLELDRVYPGVQGIGYVERMSPRAAIQLAKKVHSTTELSDFHIWPDLGPKLVDQTDVLPVVYLEPLTWRNRRTLGFDMNMDDHRRAAMEKARDTGRPAITQLVRLLQESDKEMESGFIVYVPLYKRADIAPSVEARRANLVGYIYAPFRVRDLFRAIQDEAERDQQPLDFEIYDTATTSGLRMIYDSDAVPSPFSFENENFRGWHETIPVHVADTVWRVEIFSPMNVGSAVSLRFPIVVFFIGIFTSLLLLKLGKIYHASELQTREEKRVLKLVNSIGLNLRADIDANRIIDRVTQLATEITRADGGAYYATDDEGKTPLNRIAENKTVSNLLRLTLSPQTVRLLLGQDLKRAESLAIENVPRMLESLPLNSSEVFNGAVGSALIVPIIDRTDRRLGLLILVSRRPKFFKNSDLHLVEGVCAQAAVALDNSFLIQTSIQRPAKTPLESSMKGFS